MSYPLKQWANSGDKIGFPFEQWANSGNTVYSPLNSGPIVEIQ